MATGTVYAASVNPPRSAKRARSPSLSQSSSASEYSPDEPQPQPRRSAPLSPKLSRTTAPTDRPTAEPSSRLVPAEYGQQPPAPAADEEEDGDDGEFEGGGGGKKTGKNSKGAGKREEKEKEFKLEILVRTVSYMQDLIDRVAGLEEAAATNKSLTSSCANCAEGKSSLKRKRAESRKEEGPVAKRLEADSAPRPEGYTGGPLPSISSWLPETSMRPSPRPSPEFQSHLPSPPSSTQFAPTRTLSQPPPALNLGPIATHALLSSRTPEDESAASLLLEISASSPTFPTGPRQIQTPSSLLGLIGK
ncbi:hypothetical protein B0H14DRAFT_3014668 [Mycena olivaceomarginata]|nr:hypothetical protein B0H14DRAFT_3014668 [Mycena olivaceomarginata]